MASNQIALFNFYHRYKWGDAKFTEWQQGMIDYAKAIQEGAFGGAILNGGAVSASGMSVNVNPFIATGPTGNLLVVNSIVNVPIAAPSATNRRDYIVARPLLENSEYITSPTDPNVSVPLKVLQKAQVVQIVGTIGATPAYPTLGANDVVLAGVSVKNGQVSLTDVDLDLEVRDIVGKKSLIQQNAGKYDDRLRPFKSTNQILGIKPSQLDAPNARAFSFVSRQTPSIFPKTGGLYTHSDTLINLQTGAITGGDGTSADFTPTIPSSGNAIVASVNITTSDTLSITYGTAGTRQQCYDGIKNALAAGAGSLSQAANTKPIAFVIVHSSNGTAVTDIDFVDARSPAVVDARVDNLDASMTYIQTSLPAQVLLNGTADTYTDLAGMSLTITVPGIYMIGYDVSVAHPDTTSRSDVILSIRDGSNAVLAKTSAYLGFVPTSGAGPNASSATRRAFLTVTTVPVTYKLSYKRSSLSASTYIGGNLTSALTNNPDSDDTIWAVLLKKT